MHICSYLLWTIYQCHGFSAQTLNRKHIKSNSIKRCFPTHGSVVKEALFKILSISMIKRHEQTGLHISRYKIIKFPFTYKLTFHGMISIIHLHDHNAYMEIFNI